MKKTVLCATAGFLAVGGVASASNDVKYDLNFVLAGGQSITFTLAMEPNEKFITGFSFSGHYDDMANDSSWASDLRMDLIIGNNVLSYGGFDNPSNLWDFDGAGSDLDGTYSHDGHGTMEKDKPEFIQVTFTNDWGPSGGHDWTNVSLVIHKVPAPGALALLGAAGLVGARRRRR